MGWVVKIFGLGLGYQSNKLELSGWVKKIPKPNGWTMYTPTYVYDNTTIRYSKVFNCLYE